MTLLETIFGELGISQYLSGFIDQGFDSWDTILDITESDLDTLGVKLGHRRVSGPTFLIHDSSRADSTKKLQRRIANYRGVAPDASLVSPTRASIEDTRHDSNRADFGRTDSKVGPIVAKRKYRRHPKPDENAPERPPSAYVLFSNKMREDLKGQNLTFTEIAKLVGENWQNLGRAEKEPFERQANEAKEKYNHDLAEYKKTAEYGKYNDYLHEFRKRQAVQTRGRYSAVPVTIVDIWMSNPETEKDAAKRLKTDIESTRGSSTSAASIGPGGTTSGTGSGSESQHGSEPPPSRQQRLGSIASLSTMTSHVDDSLASPRMVAHEESNHGRRRGLSNPHTRDTSTYSASRHTGWTDGQGSFEDTSGSGVPWLDPRAAPTNIAQSPEVGVLGIHPGLGSHTNRSSRGSRSSASTSVSHRPSLKHDNSSHGSNTSTISSHPPRTPSDASLPIHALLSSKSEEPPPSYIQTSSLPILNGQISQVPLPGRQAQPGGLQGSFHGSPHFKNSMPSFMPGSRPNHLGQTPSLPHEAMANLPYEPVLAATSNQASIAENGLDGISALLRARDIVDRRS
ncbi:hypothetical protein HD806DRAFT_522676 [Xylariaceae sp. AK1471]|nr:hypothetical protein HD806DRAFT_522676 [Xylariaceae sp. AK1471]